MRVKYIITKRIELAKKVKYYNCVGHGEIVGFIQGNDKEPDKFLIADDESETFIKINISDCFKE